MIKKIEEEKSKSMAECETHQIRIDKQELKIQKMTHDLESTTRNITLMENLKDQFERDNKNLYAKNK